MFSSRIVQISCASLLSFFLGTAAGAVSSYVTVRADAAALTARVMVTEQRLTSLEQGVAEWRNDDTRTAGELATQIRNAVDILTDLRIRLGPAIGKR